MLSSYANKEYGQPKLIEEMMTLTCFASSVLEWCSCRHRIPDPGQKTCSRKVACLASICGGDNLSCHSTQPKNLKSKVNDTFFFIMALHQPYSNRCYSSPMLSALKCHLPLLSQRFGVINDSSSVF